jgi:hypothetical protein
MNLKKHYCLNYFRIVLIIIPINNPNLWTNNNIAYFRSSGRSNSTPQYSNTWFPLGGIVEQNNTISNLVKIALQI